MTTLRTAAQQALEALEDFRFAAGFDRPLAQDAIDALRAALAQQDEPVQEPVAWYQKRGQEVLTSHPACWGREDEPWTPLYTTPPQRLPLTEEEINALELPPSGTATVRDLVRLIERAHGIGEQS